MPDRKCTIAVLGDGALTPAHAAQIDAIFFEASGRTFASGADRDAFRERWLGRYLHGGTDVVVLALDAAQAVAGYLVGALEDPSRQPRFADIPYFSGAFGDLCPRYPAHLHINIAPAFRSRGVGADLIAAFAARACGAGAPGMHVVTGRNARNIRFYTRCGFVQLREAVWNTGEIVFLGRSLPIHG
ncbi:MAG: GNAT family N-acetyltransferase [Hyphomonadaceae bacterium]|jgi:GNAT superfamily N-acetyltransferase|nr:GNAT family N-acetyltransferase [Hyphomonadaceae bacterium]